MSILLDFFPSRTQFVAGDSVSFVLDSSITGNVRVSVRKPGKEIFSREFSLLKGRQTVSLGVFPPGGYAVHADGFSSAFDVVNYSNEYIRYGFLTDFSSTDVENLSGVEQLARYHITHVQFYDWMYRHHDLLPPSDDFVDAMGRNLSFEAVRAKIAVCLEYGMVPMAYAAVYGAEKEWFAKHPETMFYRDDGKMVDFIDIIGIADISPESIWINHFLDELRKVRLNPGFKGFHLDQYGFPKTAMRVSGDRVDLSSCFKPLIDRAKAVSDETGQSAVFFNCVNVWPLESTASSSADAIYIEVWDPNSAYRDLANLCRQSRALAPGKTVVLAAYIHPFKCEGSENEKENAALLTRAVISANGGDHLILGERNGILREGYYADYGVYSDGFASRLRVWQDFLVRYRDIIFDHSLQDISRTWFGGVNNEIQVTGAAVTVDYRPGSVGISVTMGKSGITIHFINLTGLTDDNWNVLRVDQRVSPSLDVSVYLPDAAAEGFYASPDISGGDEQCIRFADCVHPQGRALRVCVPGVRLWTILHIPFRT